MMVGKVDGYPMDSWLVRINGIEIMALYMYKFICAGEKKWGCVSRSTIIIKWRGQGKKKADEGPRLLN